MSHVFELTDEEYTTLEQVAMRHGSTAEDLFRTWIGSIIASTGQTPTANLEHWAAAGVTLSEEELRTHPLLRVAGIFASGAPGWADDHDAVIAGEAMDSHADE